MTTNQLLIIIGAFFLFATVWTMVFFITRKRRTEPKETRSCVLCNQSGTTWSKQKAWDCCERLAVVCGICVREAGDKLDTRLNAWHEKLFCPESIAQIPIFEKMERREKDAVEEMRKNPEAIHENNLAAARLHRAEKEIQADLAQNDKLKWAHNMLANAKKDERRALWIALNSEFASGEFETALKEIIAERASA